ncbi:putative lipoprotein [Escherichia coli 3-267-03_S4_C2]|nr:putative lipoprotein [Escherichia coli 2780750]END50346.1 putative lipoprotein [Escherichia coli MP020980.1]KDU23888.1 putative lipoprotein [Escherichia coli 3-267-03_S4_C2]
MYLQPAFFMAMAASFVASNCISSLELSPSAFVVENASHLW